MDRSAPGPLHDPLDAFGRSSLVGAGGMDRMDHAVNDNWNDEAKMEQGKTEGGESGVELAVAAPARPNGWVVYRCAGTETLEFEDLLNGNGIQAWSPRCWVARRVPRRRARVWRIVPIMRSYVFVSADDADKIQELPRAIQEKGKVMVVQSRFVVVSDQDLDGLREFDQREPPQPRRKSKHLPGPKTPQVPPPPVYRVGQRVFVKGVLGGVEAEVIAIVPGGEYTVAPKNSPIKVTVSGFMLSQVGVYLP